MLGLVALGPNIGWIAASTLAALWVILPISQIPWVPWTVRIRIGKPIRHEVLFPDDGEATLARAYERVRAAVEDLVNARDRAHVGENAGATDGAKIARARRLRGPSGCGP